jgi:arylsulfatase A-like enzyme
MNGRKRSLYEGGIHLPFFVRWPGQVPAGKVNHKTVLAAVDLLPTVCAAAGISLPEGYVPDGQNMLEAWKGAELQRSKPLFWEWRGSAARPEYWPRAAIRDGPWKLLTDLQKRTELYRLPEDWAETNNLAKQHPDIVARLAKQLAEWRATLPKQLPANCLSLETRDRASSAAANDASRPATDTLMAPRGQNAPNPNQDTRKPAPDRAKIFDRWDTDQDGTLALNEYRAGLKEKPDAEKRFRVFDKNGDGKLSREEFVNPTSRGTR